VDACVLTSSDSLLLQQASHLSGGIYYRMIASPGTTSGESVHMATGLLQYLLTIFLPAPSLRKHLVLPTTGYSQFILSSSSSSSSPSSYSVFNDSWITMVYGSDRSIIVPHVSVTVMWSILALSAPCVYRVYQHHPSPPFLFI
jgi:hypothetical protein